MYIIKKLHVATNICGYIRSFVKNIQETNPAKLSRKTSLNREVAKKKREQKTNKNTTCK